MKDQIIAKIQKVIKLRMVMFFIVEAAIGISAVFNLSPIYATGCDNALGLCTVSTGGAVSSISTTSQLSQLAANVIDIVVGIAGFLTILFIVLGGIKLITSSGDTQKIAEGRKMVIAATIGLALVLLSWVIAHLVMQITGVSNSYSQ